MTKLLLLKSIHNMGLGDKSCFGAALQNAFPFKLPDNELNFSYHVDPENREKDLPIFPATQNDFPDLAFREAGLKKLPLYKI